VSLSLSIIIPVLMMVFWCWIFIGAKSRSGMSFAFCRVRGMQYPYLTSFSKSLHRRTRFLLAPLWFPNSITLLMSAFQRSLSRCSSGQWDPLVRTLFICGQIEQCLKIRLTVDIFLNSDPIPRGESVLESKACISQP
jgi:hypothetical protein